MRLPISAFGTALSTHLPPVIVYITGLAWVLAGVVLFGYLYKVRRELGLLPDRAARSGREPN